MDWDREMQKALEADGEKLRQLTGEDHRPWSLEEILAPEPTIKPLSWDDHSKMNADGEHDNEGTDLRAVTSIGTYYITFDHFHRVPFELNPPHGGNNEHFDRIEAAKARAEELHVIAVSGCLALSPADGKIE